MLILQARNWNRPHSLTALQQKSKRPSKTWVQCHARIFLNCSVLSQHLSGGSMTTITIISRNWANCIPRLSFAKKKWKWVLFKNPVFDIFIAPFLWAAAHLPKSGLIDQQACGIPDEHKPGGSPPLLATKKVWKYKNKQKQKIQNTYWATSFWWNITTAQQKVSGIDLKNCKSAVSLSVVC